MTDQEKERSASVRILLIEDNPGDAFLVRDMLTREPGFLSEIRHVFNLAAGLQALSETTSYDVVLADLSLPDSRGLETFKAVQKMSPDIPVIVFTGFDDKRLALEALSLGAEDYVVKGKYTGDLLVRIILYAMERKKVQKEMRRLASFPTLEPSPVVEIDFEGRVTYANPAALEAFPTLSSQQITHSILADLKPALLVIGKADETTFTREVNYGERIYERRIHRLPEAGVHRLHILDVTDRKILERMKDEFISLASHELRSPLTVLHAGLMAMRAGVSGKLDERQMDFLGGLISQAERMSRLIANLLNLARLESRKGTLNMQPLSTPSLLAEAADYQRMIPGNDRVLISVQAASDLPKVRADRDLFIEVLDNLLSNALRFAASTVVLRAEAQRAGDGGANAGRFIVFAVADDGPGIPADKIGSLFQKFVQVQRPKNKGYKGTGLGLSICKEIVEMFGGRIWAESPPDGGAVFSFALPVAGEDGNERRH